MIKLRQMMRVQCLHISNFERSLGEQFVLFPGPPTRQDRLEMNSRVC